MLIQSPLQATPIDYTKFLAELQAVEAAHAEGQHPMHYCMICGDPMPEGYHLIGGREVCAKLSCEMRASYDRQHENEQALKGYSVRWSEGEPF